MDTNTVASLFSFIKDQGEWTSSSICLPVFESIDSDEVVEVDLCNTQCRPGQEWRTRMTATATDAGHEFNFRVSFIYSELPNFSTSEFL